MSLDILRIDWNDHYSGTAGWADIEDVNTKHHMNTSVGLKVKETNDIIVLAQNLGASLRVSDTIHIIKNNIVGQKKLGEVRYVKG